MSVLLPEELSGPVPKLTKVSQKFDSTCIDDVEGAIREEMKRPGTGDRVKPGDRVAIGVGSRGICAIHRMVRALVDEVRKRGGEPFIVSAMGSHGGGTAEGQREVLAGYGITEEEVNAPVLVSMEVVKLGETAEGHPVYTDKTAWEADLTILINRVKPHTDFEGDIQSGLCKMSVIGLGNHIGCASVHKTDYACFSQEIGAMAEVVLHRSNMAFGIAVVENAQEKPCHIEAVPKECFIQKDCKLLALAKERMPRLPFRQIDILVVEEIGKNISGNGADPNIVGRHGPMRHSKDIPQIDWMVILALSQETHGNAIGIGMADFTTKAAVEAMDFQTTYINCLASHDNESGRLPFVMSDEKEALAGALKLWGGRPEECRMVRIRNTMELETLLVSEPLLAELRKQPDRFAFPDN